MAGRPQVQGLAFRGSLVRGFRGLGIRGLGLRVSESFRVSGVGASRCLGLWVWSFSSSCRKVPLRGSK